MRAYWARGEGRGNFGDLLTELLFRRLRGCSLEWSEREDAELFGAGSIAELIPHGFTGYVIGSGCMFGDPIDLSSSRILSLRGARTAHAAGIRGVLLASLGLLARDLIDGKIARNIEIGTVRTGGDPRPAMGLRLDPEAGDPERLVRDMARCRRIVSSSLHGLIVADALGIPNMWDPFLEVDAGCGFKFHDYASAYGERIEPFRWRLADQRIVSEKQAALRDAMAVVVP